MQGRFYHHLLLAATLLAGPLGCTRQLAPAGRSPTYELTRLKRRNRTSAPIVCGTIDQRQADGRRSPPAVASRLQNVAAVWVDGALHYSQADGRYCQQLMVGRHRLRVGFPGLVRVDLTLRTRLGDSIRLDFHLRTDTTRLIN